LLIKRSITIVEPRSKRTVLQRILSRSTTTTQTKTMSAAAEAFIAFLRCEALQSEARAKQLRATAAAIEMNAERSKCDYDSTGDNK